MSFSSRLVNRLRPAHRVPRARPRLEVLEDRRLLSHGLLVEDFSDNSNPQVPALDPSGAFVHGGLMGNLQSSSAAPSPPHVLALFRNVTEPHQITFPTSQTVDYAGAWIWPQGGPAAIEFVGTQDRLRFDLPTSPAGFVFRDTTGANLGTITAINLYGAEALFDDITIHATAAPPVPTTSLSGQKFDDRNANGVRDAGEPGLDGWLMRLANAATNQFVAQQMTRSIDRNGDGMIDPETEQGLYELPDLAPGTYLVHEHAQPGWYQTFPGFEGSTQLLSAGAQGAASNHSFRPALSTNAQVLVFESDADNLVPGDTNGMRDVFVFHRLSGELRRVSVDRTGRQADGPSYAAAVSGSGGLVAFVSEARNLVPDPGLPGVPQVYLYNLFTQEIVRVSNGPGGAAGNGASLAPSLDLNGDRLVFQSAATNLVAGDSNDAIDVFVYDTLRQTVRRVSERRPSPFLPPTQGDGHSTSPMLSNDGHFVAFESFSGNLVDGDTNRRADVFVAALDGPQAGAVEVVSVGDFRGDILGGYDPSISADGRFVAYVRDFVGPEDNRFQKEIFVRDRQTGRNERITVNPTGVRADGNSQAPAISADGRHVVFQSESVTLVPGDTNQRQSDLFLYDRELQRLVRLPVAGDGPSFAPTLNGTGQVLAFASYAGNLVSGDTNGAADIFVQVLHESVRGHFVTLAEGEQRTGLNFGNHHFEPGTFQFSAGLYEGNENAGQVTITITRTGGSDGRVVVPYSILPDTVPGGASPTTDFASVASAITFFAGETSKTFTVSITNDGLPEPDEKLIVSLSPPSVGALGLPSEATVIIRDNDRQVITGPEEEFVASLYDRVLGREADRAGLALWAGRLEAGVSRDEVLQGFLTSSEYRTNLVREAYRSLLGREPDEVGLRGWIQFLEAGGSSSDMRMSILLSPEYRRERTGGGDPGAPPGGGDPGTPGGGDPGAPPGGGGPGFIAALYRDVLGREVDPTGAEVWGRVLREENGPARVVQGLMLSEEAADNTVRRLYSRYLDRQPDLAGALASRRQAQAGEPLESLIGNVVHSPEYGCLVEARQTGNLRWVERMYDDLLRRPPTCEEIEALIDQLVQGVSRDAVALQMTRSLEYRLQVVREEVARFLHLDTSTMSATDLAGQFSQPGIQVRVQSTGNHIRLRQGQTVIEPYLAGDDEYFPIGSFNYLDVLTHIASSTAFENLHPYHVSPNEPDAVAFLDAITLDLGVGPIPEDLRARVIEDMGDIEPPIFEELTPENVFAGMLRIVEGYLFSQPYFLGPLVEGYYQRFLNRASDEAGLAGWTNALDSNARSPGQVIAFFLGSPEYFQLAQR